MWERGLRRQLESENCKWLREQMVQLKNYVTKNTLITFSQIKRPCGSQFGLQGRQWKKLFPAPKTNVRGPHIRPTGPTSMHMDTTFLWEGKHCSCNTEYSLTIGHNTRHLVHVRMLISSWQLAKPYSCHGDNLAKIIQCFRVIVGWS